MDSSRREKGERRKPKVVRDAQLHGGRIDVADERPAVGRRVVEPRRTGEQVVEAPVPVDAGAAARRDGRADGCQVRIGKTGVDEIVVRR